MKKKTKPRYVYLVEDDLGTKEIFSSGSKAIRKFNEKNEHEYDVFNVEYTRDRVERSSEDENGKTLVRIHKLQIR